jgi:uncharacterized membrane protein YwaF
MNLFNFYTMEPRFEMFSISHIMAIILTWIVEFYSVYYFRKQIKGNQKGEKTFRYSIAFVLSAGEVLLQYWYITTKSWKIEYGLPLQLCDVSIFTSIIMLILRKLSNF